MTLPLTPQVFVILRGLIEERTGLYYGDADRDMLAEKVSARAEEAGFETLLDYYYFLRYDPAGDLELDTLVEYLVVKETYLFRELEQLRVLVARIVRPWAERRRVRIWSAACATGEEPVSLAALLGQEGLLERVELVASDISARALERARSGLMSRRSLRLLAPDQHAAWLHRRPDGTAQVDPELLRRISWRRVNLTDAAQVTAMGRFDVVLCRNVLIYFADETASRVVDALAETLHPDGLLVVSVTESLLRLGTSLACEEQAGVFFYRKGTR
jgi:chemotaxis protein methyltransferase CheR